MWIELSDASVAVKAPAGIVLTKLPDMLEVTSTATRQDPGVVFTWADTEPPTRDNLFAMVVTVPPQVVEMLAGLAKDSPAGKVSTQAAGSVDNVRANELGL